MMQTALCKSSLNKTVDKNENSPFKGMIDEYTLGFQSEGAHLNDAIKPLLCRFEFDLLISHGMTHHSQFSHWNILDI